MTTFNKIKWTPMHNHPGTYFALLLLALLAFGCDPEPTRQVTSINVEDWGKRQAPMPPEDSLLAGSTYLSSYSKIYTKSEISTLGLTGTISMRNINLTDTIYIERAHYHQTDGKQIRNYFDKPIYIAPLETVEIIITEEDVEGGTGDSFVFNWRKPTGTHDPFFEGVFISTYGRVSFTTRGIRIE
ncbi:MAG: DUF3124 domain-containing protein [Lewinella sp.]|nr:DUF3124 domain-containing protein [Lewinella sp.]